MLRVLLLGLICVFLCDANATSLDRLPDGEIASAAGRGAIQAWYGAPTTRYPHGALGDNIEAGSLIVVDQTGKHHTLILPESEVFEDITPRLADLDQDGNNEIITIKSITNQGAQVVIYAIINNTLREVAKSIPIGTNNRWLSIAAIGNFLNTKNLSIAIVKTPHIGGILEILSLKGSELITHYPPKAGFTTHVFGSRILSLATAKDVTHDGVDELIIPSQDRRTLHILSLGKGIRTIFEKKLPSPVTQQISVKNNIIHVTLENNDTIQFSSNSFLKFPH